MADLTSLSSTSQAGASQSDLLVEAYKQTQQSKIDTLSSKKKTLESRQIFYNQLKSKLDNLLSNIDKFTTSNASDKFITRTISSSNSAVATASVTSEGVIGINNLKVNRLATNDILIAKRLNIGSSDTFGVTGNNLTFKINGEEVSVNLDSGITNENAMKAIASAINANSDTNVSASYIKDTSSTGRLTFTSKNTGTDNKITFDDNSSGVLNQLGLDNLNPLAADRTQLNNSGTQYAHYKISAAANLDSLIEINGIEVTRSSNTLTDVLQGVTINLLKTQESSESSVVLTTSANPSAAQSLVNPLLSSYNDLISFIKQNASSIRTESAVNSLSSKLRSASTQAITPADNDDPKYLTDIGIKISSDGSLSIDDASRFAEVLKDDPNKVANLFVGTTGFANRMKDSISSLVGEDGLILARKVSIRKQIEANDTRTKEVTDRIDRQAEALRKEYQDMLQVFMKAQSQYNSLSTNFLY